MANLTQKMKLHDSNFNCNITKQMKAASVTDIRKELDHLNTEKLRQLCVRMARFKLENKELLTYLLFESENEERYIQSIKEFTDEQFSTINYNNYYYIKKSVRKILRHLKKYCRYSNLKDTEIEILIYYCEKLKEIQPSIFNNKTLTNLFERQLNLIQKKASKLHEDLQYDYNIKLKDLKQ